MDAKDRIAQRVAQEVVPGSLVNLGIGLPSLVASYVAADQGVYFQSENGVIGLGSRPPEGMEDPDLTDAGGGFVTAVPGAAAIDSAMSFGLIRGGHIDLTVLGALQVDSTGHLANWMIPGRLTPGMGGRDGSCHRRKTGHRCASASNPWANQDRKSLRPANNVNAAG